ncbi:MAG: hypothetical protein AAGD22_01770 [Verrucomicrobiota bacterium]
MKSLLICAVAVGSLLIPTIAIPEENETDSKQLVQALAGTEWFMYWRDGGKKGERVIRFTAEGTMRYQTKTRRWKDDLFVEEKTYKVMGPREIQFGADRYFIEFDEDMERFSGTSSKHQDRTVRGSLLGTWKNSIVP